MTLISFLKKKTKMYFIDHKKIFLAWETGAEVRCNSNLRSSLDLLIK